MSKTYHPTRREAERHFLHHVDVPVSGAYWGARFNAMKAWCYHNVPLGEWAQFDCMEQRDANTSPCFKKFLFFDLSMADAFRRQWVR